MQVLCPSYFYVNSVRARYDYLLRLETWNMYYGVGKTATAILNEATTRRNENFNNVVGSQKGAWCQSLKEFGIKHFGWAPLFEVIKDPPDPLSSMRLGFFSTPFSGLPGFNTIDLLGYGGHAAPGYPEPIISNLSSGPWSQQSRFVRWSPYLP